MIAPDVLPALYPAASSSSSSGGGGIFGILIFIVPIAALFLFMSRQNKRKQAAARQLGDNLAPGVEVVTVGGLHATVHSVEDDLVELLIAPGVIAKFGRRAIAEVIPPPAYDDPEIVEPDPTSDPAPDN